MTRPGPHPWATDDTWTSGPDIGQNTKAQPPQANMDEGYYRQRRPGPDVLNWQLNRANHVHQSVARLQALNYQISGEDPVNMPFGSGLGDLLQIATRRIEDNHVYLTIIGYNLAGTRLEEWNVEHCEYANPSGYNVVDNTITSAPDGVDADADDGSHVVCVSTFGGAGSGLDKVVYCNTFAGPYAGITFTAGAPSYEWYSVGCDRNTAGGASAHWCIGAYTAAGTSAAIWSSTDGINFAVESGFSTANGAVVYGIYHSNHPAGALGPDDPGNPVWLAWESYGIHRSTDHVTWTGPVATGYNGSNPRSLAYSRVSRRWVAAHSDTDFGRISYSDDNGATWTTIANALPIETGMNVAGVEAHIAGDGYGTFVVTRHNEAATAGGSYIWVSVDEGLTWTITRVGELDGAYGSIIEFLGSLGDVDGTDPVGGMFAQASYVSNPTPKTYVYKSLIV